LLRSNYFTCYGNDREPWNFLRCFLFFYPDYEPDCGYYAVEVSVLYNWQQFFVLISILCFGLAILQWIFMHDQYFALKVPLHYIDWLSILLFVATFMFSAYVFAFGKQQDWLNSKNIINASIGAFVSFALLVTRQTHLKRPYLSFKVFSKVMFFTDCLCFFVWECLWQRQRYRIFLPSEFWDTTN
jgi:hypothetical protein